jgi:undecaprenyl-diphosphatase
MLRPAAHRVATVVTALAGAVLVLTLGFVMTAHPVDFAAVVAVNRHHTGAWAVLANTVYEVFRARWAVLLTAVVAVVVGVVGRSARGAIAFAAVVALTWAPVWLFKLIVHRPRPDQSLLTYGFARLPPDAAFPSGHTAFVAALGAGMWFVARDSRWRWLVVGVAGLVTALVGWTVVSTGVHYPTDVVGAVVWVVVMAPTARLVVVDIGMARWARPAQPRPYCSNCSAVPAKRFRSIERSGPAWPGRRWRLLYCQEVQARRSARVGVNTTSAIQMSWCSKCPAT